MFFSFPWNYFLLVDELLKESNKVGGRNIILFIHPLLVVCLMSYLTANPTESVSDFITWWLSTQEIKRFIHLTKSWNWPFDIMRQASLYDPCSLERMIQQFNGTHWWHSVIMDLSFHTGCTRIECQENKLESKFEF